MFDLNPSEKLAQLKDDNRGLLATALSIGAIVLSNVIAYGLFLTLDGAWWRWF